MSTKSAECKEQNGGLSQKYSHYRSSTAADAEVLALSLKYGADAPVLLVSKTLLKDIAPTATLRATRDRSCCNLANGFPENTASPHGIWFASSFCMAVTRVEDFAAYDFAVRFKLEVYRLIHESRGASKNQEYREQLEEAASGIEGAMSEGFGRRRPKEFALYLRYSLGSLNESKTRLRDGIHRGYFREPACEQAFIWAQRCERATSALWRSQVRKAAEEERELKSRKARSKDAAKKKGASPADDEGSDRV